MPKKASAKKSILIVEDDRPILKSLMLKFENEGFEVHQALNGKEGLREALDVHPDVILLDIIMPEMDGMTMLEELRKDKWGDKAEVLFLTNLSSPNHELKAEEQGVKNYLLKADWSINDLVKKVNEIIEK
ncbi:response regulator [Patescibacteria group bacterium]|nr:response regulator [Patescibacteria group bacterium]MBU1673528.1 response regulator [Patescibacteria group bacterium]MBU1963712.1 response regulator [Patescibacteria group bacterium]